MGMFDDIRCDAELPKVGPDPKTRCFQTKDRECQLDQYVITADGRLLLDGDPVDFHGMLNFHHFDNKSATYWQWVAKFTDGRLIEIKPVEIHRLISPYPNLRHHHYFPTDAAPSDY